MPTQRVPDRTYPPDAIERARHLADLAHEGQYDKVGRPYIEHPARVATYVQITSRWCGLDADEQYDATVAAWLHDVLEDSHYTIVDLRRRGFSERALEAVALLTRDKNVAKEEYYALILNHPVARAAKWADILDNTDPNRLAQLPASTSIRLIHKYDEGAACLNISPSPTQWWRAQRGPWQTGQAGQPILTAPDLRS